MGSPRGADVPKVAQGRPSPQGASHPEDLRGLSLSAEHEVRCPHAPTCDSASEAWDLGDHVEH